MSLEARIERRRYLVVEFYEETPESLTSPRGLGETSVVHVRADGHDENLVRIELAGTAYFVPRKVLKELAKV